MFQLRVTRLLLLFLTPAHLFASQAMASNVKGRATATKGTSARKANASETLLESAGEKPAEMNKLYFYLIFYFDHLDCYLT